MKSLEYYRQHTLEFIETVLFDPETGAPFKLLPAERDFLIHAFKRGDNGRLLYSELVYSAPKKSGKTTLAAIIVLTVIVLFGGRNGEAVLAANDFEQSRARVYEMIRRIIEASPLLAAEANITSNKTTIGGATITAIPADYASAAGANQNIAVFDELWAYASERARRLFDELVPPPTKQIACRLTVTYAGFSGEGELLEELYARGIKQPEVAPNLHAGDGILMAWHHDPVAPWQTDTWLADMQKSLRPNQYQRMIRNEFVEAEASFINMDLWDQCVDPFVGHKVADKSLICWAAVDASMRHDATALVLVSWDQQNQRVVLCDHRIFIPTAEQPINFSIAVEQTILDWHHRFSLQSVTYDPYQMTSSAQFLQRQAVNMQDTPRRCPT